MIEMRLAKAMYDNIRKSTVKAVLDFNNKTILEDNQMPSLISNKRKQIIFQNWSKSSETITLLKWED